MNSTNVMDCSKTDLLFCSYSLFQMLFDRNRGNFSLCVHGRTVKIVI